LDHADDLKFFQEGCKLPIGPSDGLAKLASEVIGKETIDTKSKSCLSRHEDLDAFILFYRPRRFGKSLTISMLEHFHGLQYAGEHQSLYKVCISLITLDIRTYFSVNHSRVSMCKRISKKKNASLDSTLS
jgi:Predicted AAA-ATPase